VNRNLTRAHYRDGHRGRHRGQARAIAVRPGYPHDYLHADRPYEQTQSDIGGSLFLGAITLIALMALIVIGLV
jgi:hypothetical protein